MAITLPLYGAQAPLSKAARLSWPIYTGIVEKRLHTTMAHCSFIDFEITIHGQQAPYLVHAAYRQQTASSTLAEDATHPVWAARLARLAAPRGQPGQEELEAIGALLYHQLFHADVRELWLQARSDLEHNRAGVCIRLMAQPPAVAALPWEALYDPDRRVVFAGSLRTPLVRSERLLRQVGPSRPLAATLPLRLLAALPTDPSDQIDGAAELDRLQAVLAPSGQAVVQTLQGQFSVVDLRQKIAALQPDIVHLVTHGSPEGVLLWQQEQAVLTPAPALRTALEGAESVKLVVLNACATAAHGSLRQGLASVGAQLLQAGIPAVIAMQFDVEEGVATDFTQYFYQELFGGTCPGLVSRAVSLARSNLYALNPASLGYTTPILWLNAAEGQLFAPATSPAAAPPAAAPPAAAPALELAALRRQTDQLEAGLAGLAVLRSAPLPGALRPLLQMFQDALRVCEDLLVQLHRLDSAPPTEQLLQHYREKLDRLGREQAAVERQAALIRASLEQRGQAGM